MAADQADDLDKAILISFAQDGQVEESLKRQAAAYCGEFKASPGCLEVCLRRLPSSPYIEVRFWCLQTVHEILQSRPTRVEPQQLELVKQTVWSWVRGAGQNSIPAFLKNKIAQNAACLLQMDFEGQWAMLMGILPDGAGAADMLCRILVAIDEDIVSLDIPRSPDGIKASMEFKDTMRETCLTDLAGIWYNLVATYSESNPDLAEAVLAAVRRYVSWIDIGLVANNRFVPMLVALLGAASGGLAGAAADVLSEIVLKRMDSTAKLRLVQQLSLGPMMAAWAERQLAQPSALEVIGPQCARLLSALVTEALEAWKKVENSIVSFTAVGISIDSEAASEASAACTTAQALIVSLFPAVLSTLQSGDEEVEGALVPFLQAYVARLRAGQKRGSPASQESRQHVRGILEAVAGCAKYPDTSSAAALDPSDRSAQALAAAEAEHAAAERRQELFVLLRNAAKVFPEEGYAVVGPRLQALASEGDTDFKDAELAVTLLYELGEGASEEAMKPGTGALAQLAQGVMQMKVPASHHRLVSLAIMETFVRYNRVLQHSQHCLPSVLQTFLGDKGIGHPDKAVGTRACYLFSRLAKSLRQNLRPLLSDILVRLQPHLAHILASPLPEAEPAAKGLKTKAAQSQGASMDDRLYAFEAAGQLLGQEDLAIDEQEAAVRSLLQPLQQQMDEQLASAGKAPQGSVQRRAAEALVQQALDAASRASKGFSLALCTQKRPRLGDLLAGPLQAAISIPQVLPENRVLRGRLISFLHRLVECLGERLLPYLPPALSALLPLTADASTVSDVCALLSQLALKYKAALVPLLAEVVPEMVARVHALLPASYDWSGADGKPGASEDRRERAEVQRSYYAFLNALAQSRLLQCLQGSAGTLDAVLEALLRGASTHIEPQTRKTCVQVLRQLVLEMRDASGAVPQQLKSFVMEQCAGTVCLAALRNSRLDVRDAAVSTLLTDLTQLLLTCAAASGGELPNYLKMHVLPRLSIPPGLQEGIVKDVAEGEASAKQLKGHLKSLLQAVNGLASKHGSSSSREGREASATNGVMPKMSDPRMSDGMLSGMSD
ncbi:hypothetical protein CVIRNUC_005994 [Coccomyxa viridis]|uniref:Exportin-T n=1 Tax=Coccomyxa viridis TaxID=1274662 RepID=A0AAV1I6V4_9CHLO|nr:hypothetical protein CVIRNUC_005994 [Coccomyxa viridis]